MRCPTHNRSLHIYIDLLWLQLENRCTFYRFCLLCFSSMHTRSQLERNHFFFENAKRFDNWKIMTGIRPVFAKVSPMLREFLCLAWCSFVQWFRNQIDKLARRRTDRQTYSRKRSCSSGLSSLVDIGGRSRITHASLREGVLVGVISSFCWF